mmetsp:Transcript_16710/g.42686  ORF Transcript_16710/g.42686 Transcript_16710/m.42686 type:complete len:204 (-) Transcript_16710:297-908(-)
MQLAIIIETYSTVIANFIYDDDGQWALGHSLPFGRQTRDKRRRAVCYPARDAVYTLDLAQALGQTVHWPGSNRRSQSPSLSIPIASASASASAASGAAPAAPVFPRKPSAIPASSASQPASRASLWMECWQSPRRAKSRRFAGRLRSTLSSPSPRSPSFFSVFSEAASTAAFLKSSRVSPAGNMLTSTRRTCGLTYLTSPANG